MICNPAFRRPVCEQILRESRSSWCHDSGRSAHDEAIGAAMS
jgi:hypothetical protein